VADHTATPGVTSDDKSPDAIEREMELTRESITEKVAALESQVIGTIQTATDTLTETVESVKTTVTTAPSAVKETVHEAVAAVKDTVKETLTSVKESVASFSVSECVRDNPVAAVGTSLAGGFVTGYLLFGERPLMARGSREPAPRGRVGSVPHEFAAFGTSSTSPHAAPARPGMFAGLMAMVGAELEQLAKQALTTAIASLKQSVNEKVPQIMDDAVNTLAGRVTGGLDGTHAAHGGHPRPNTPAAGL